MKYSSSISFWILSALLSSPAVVVNVKAGAVMESSDCPICADPHSHTGLCLDPLYAYPTPTTSSTFDVSELAGDALLLTVFQYALYGQPPPEPPEGFPANLQQSGSVSGSCTSLVTLSGPEGVFADCRMTVNTLWGKLFLLGQLPTLEMCQQGILSGAPFEQFCCGPMAIAAGTGNFDFTMGTAQVCYLGPSTFDDPIGALEQIFWCLGRDYYDRFAFSIEWQIEGCPCNLPK